VQHCFEIEKDKGGVETRQANKRLRLKGFGGGTKVIEARICPEALRVIKETM
jgi:hypothetical protein